MVKFINFDGKDHPVRVSFYALKMLKEKTKKRLEDIGEDDLEAYEELLFASLQAGAWATKSEMFFKREDMEKVMDIVFMDFISLIPEFFQPVKKEVVSDGGRDNSQPGES